MGVRGWTLSLEVGPLWPCCSPSSPSRCAQGRRPVCAAQTHSALLFRLCSAQELFSLLATGPVLFPLLGPQLQMNKLALFQLPKTSRLDPGRGQPRAWSLPLEPEPSQGGRQGMGHPPPSVLGADVPGRSSLGLGSLEAAAAPAHRSSSPSAHVSRGRTGRRAGGGLEPGVLAL